MEDNFILNIEVGTPVADLRRSLEFTNFQHGEIVIVVNGDSLLILGCKVRRNRFGDVIIWAISYGRSRTSYRGVQGESANVIRLLPGNNSWVGCSVNKTKDYQRRSIEVILNFTLTGSSYAEQMCDKD